MNKIQLSTILLIITLGTVFTAVFAVLSTSKTIHNAGTVKTIRVGVYNESSCTTPVTLIEWNDLVPGDNRSVTVYVRNEGSVEFILTMRTESWNPSYASEYIKFSWNRENYRLAAGGIVQATFILEVSSNVTGFEDFTFDIIITGTESA